MLLTQEQYETLDEEGKARCTEADGGWDFDLNPTSEPATPPADPDNGPLKRALDREKQLKAEAAKRADEAEKRLGEIEAQLENSQHNDLKKRGDIEALEKSWNDKYDMLRTEYEKQVTDLKGEYEGQLTAYKGTIETQLVDNVALGLASELVVDPKLAPALIPHVKSRLSVDWDAEQPQTRILSSEGQPSVLNRDDLIKELKATEHLAPLLTGTRATGSIDGEKKARKFDPNVSHDITKMGKSDAKAYIEEKMGVE